ncbi:hypothetical protein J2Z44_002279 [Clostridium punense]|uniref:Lipoprotein n=1 Tax=Clostridium punense TaxID=1054297 RepID=A0ABS4K3W7_9CLOT|nr:MULTISPECIES: hypothetical protein [Clostridium]EQB85841.1 hypothetical protein M918_17275 [Clostridium sp. BL8]MBP2022458.1 hypothetical protein [Clostridium punense]
MKRLRGIVLFLLLTSLITGCFRSTKNNATSEVLLKTNTNADFFIMDNTVYKNAIDIDWVKGISVKEGSALGRINKTKVKRNFKNWNATVLGVGTEIYKLEDRQDIVLAKKDDKYIPYIKYVEG